MDNSTDLNTKQQDLSQKVSDYFGLHVRPQIFPFFTIENLEEAFKDLVESPVRGFGHISYQLLLNSNTSIVKIYFSISTTQFVL